MKPKASRILAIDYGMARIGLAISDERKIIATPLQTLTAEKKMELTAEKLLDLLKKLQEIHHYEISEIVIGNPLRMNGQMSLLSDEVKHFVEILKKLVSCPIVLWDERLTSLQAERSLRESNMSRKKRSKMVDTVAATIILQSYLDSKPTISEGQ